MNARMCTDDLLSLTWGFWLLAWLTFATFVVLHRFAHMAYVRIMFFFALLLVVVLVGMHVVVMATTKRMMAWQDEDEDEREEEKLEQLPFTHWISLLLQFTLFFLCYGFVRMVTAPWLWHIYFYNVLTLTCIFAAVMLAFVLYLAPLIPEFYAAMSIPPNISESDVDLVVLSMKQQHDQLRTPAVSASSKSKRNKTLGGINEAAK